jgi:hypothetical protein
MKKIGFVILALILILGTMGVAFSMWSQTVTVTGQVNTGNVTLTVSNPSCDLYFKDLDAGTAGEPAGSNVWGYMVTNGSGQPSFDGNGNPIIDQTRLPFFYEQPDHGWATNPSDYLLVGWAAISSINNAAVGGPTVTATWHNIFPWPWPSSITYPPGAPSTTFATQVCDFDVTNSSSIPVRLHIVAPASVDGMAFEIGYYNPATGVWFSSGLEGMQLEPGGTVHVQLGFTVTEDSPQGFNGSFTVTIQGVQWNEYVP